MSKYNHILKCFEGRSDDAFACSCGRVELASELDRATSVVDGVTWAHTQQACQPARDASGGKGRAKGRAKR